MRHGAPKVCWALAALIYPAYLQAQPTWTVPDTPSVVIGALGSGEGHDLADVRDATVLHDGSIVVANVQTRDLRVYDPSGRYVRALGRKGRGPGEFWGAVTWVRERDDGSVVAYDAALKRETVFTLDGRALEVHTLRLPVTLAGGFVQPPFVGGTQLVVQSENRYRRFEEIRETGRLRTRRSPGRVVHDEVRFYLSEADSAWRVVSHPHPEQFELTARSEGPVATLTTWIPFGGKLLWAATDSFFVAGSSEECELAVYGPGGARLGSVRAAGARRAVTRRDRRAYSRWFLEEAGPPWWREVRAEVLEKAEWRDTIPRCDQVAIDRAGNIWLAEFTIEGEKRAWQVFTPDGAPVARALLPRRPELLEIGEDYVLALVRGAFDEEMVVLYPLQRLR